MRMMCYAYCDKLRPTFVKFGEHFISSEMTLEEAIKDTTTFVRRALSKEKHFFDIGDIKVHKIWDVSDWSKENHPDRFKAHGEIDNQIRKFVRFRVSNGSEYHNIPDNHGNAVEYIIRQVNEVLYGTAKLGDFKPHHFQQAAINKATNFFNESNNSDFLLDATMRFGKTVTAYWIAKKLNAKNILVITGRPSSTAKAWIKGIDHIDFPDWDVIDSRKVAASFNRLDDNPTVVFASFQGAKGENGRLNKIIKGNQKIDLVIVDEMHAYMSKDAVKLAVEGLNVPHRLWVSGTPFKAYEAGMFSGATDTYRFTLLNALKAKRDGDSRFKSFPEPLMLVADYPEELKGNINLYNDNEMPCFSKVLSNNNGVPNFSDEVSSLLDSLMAFNKRREHTPLMVDGRSLKLNKAKTHNHLWFAVPRGKDDDKNLSVAAATTLQHAINSKPDSSPWKQYQTKIWKSSGGERIDEDVVQDFHDHNDKTAIMSAGSGNTGTTMPLLDTLVYLKETDSAAEFWQTFGRIMNPAEGKETVSCILYGVEMYINMATKMIEYTKKDGETFDDLVEDFISLMPTYMIGNITPRRIEIEDFFNNTSTVGNVRKTFTDDRIISADFDNAIADSDVLKFLQGMPDLNRGEEQSDDNVKIAGGLITRGGNKGKKPTGAPPEPRPVNEIKQMKKRVKNFLYHLPNVMIYANVDGYVIRGLDDLLNLPTRFFDIKEFCVGGRNMLTLIVNCGIINKDELDKKISIFQRLEVDPLI